MNLGLINTELTNKMAIELKCRRSSGDIPFTASGGHFPGHVHFLGSLWKLQPHAAGTRLTRFVKDFKQWEAESVQSIENQLKIH